MRHPHVSLSLAALALLLLVPGCRPRGDGTLTDTQGVQVRFGSDERVVPLPSSPPALHCEGTMSVAATWGFRGARLVTLCPIERAEHSAIECRPLVCAGDEDCPSSWYEPIACEDGFCVRTTETWTDRDVIALCLADVPRLDDCARFFEYGATAATAVDAALARHCDSRGECAAPITCGP